MATKKKKVVQKTAAEVAAELLEVRSEINILKQAEKAISDDLKKRMKDGEPQDLYEFIPSTSLKIKDYTAVLAWAQKFVPRTLTVDTKAARAAFMGDLKGELGTPEAHGFQLVVVESLREKKAKEDEPNYDRA